MLLILMFFVVLLTFSMMAVLPRMIQQVKRDREEEMIHRGTEYARAVKKYYKKFNRYPNSIQDLENTNNIRFLRKRYKDPMSKDGNWKLLNVTDVQQGVSNPNFGVSQAGNFNPAQGGLGAQTGGAFGQQINIGGQPGGQQPPAISTDGGVSGGGTQPGGVSVTPLGGSGTTGDTGSSGTTGDTGSGNTTSSSGAGAPGNPATGGQPGQTYGAGGIVGVESVSKAKTIREFGGKHNYNKWMFIYDPTQDKGTLLKGPYNPQAFQGGTTVQPGQNGQPGTIVLPGQNGAPGTGGQGNGGQQLPPDINAPPQ